MADRRLLEVLHEHYALVQGIHRTLEMVAGDLAAVGLTKVADRITGATIPLLESATELRAAYSADLNGQLAHNKHIAGSLLVAALNGNLVPSKAKGDA